MSKSHTQNFIKKPSNTIFQIHTTGKFEFIDEKKNSTNHENLKRKVVRLKMSMQTVAN